MAKRTIARPLAPASSNAPTATPGGPDGTDGPGGAGGPGAADLLETTLAQLTSLLWACHGDGTRWGEKEGQAHLDNVFWLAWELSRKAQALFQECAKKLDAPA